MEKYKKLDLQLIMNSPVTSKSYSVCSENDKTRSNRNTISSLKPTNIPPADVKVCVVDAMRVLSLIPITTVQPPTFMKWAEAVKIYLENLPGNTTRLFTWR